MSGMTRALFVALFLVAGITAGLGLGRTFEAGPVAPQASADLIRLQDAFSAASEFAMKSVVHITTQSVVASDFFQPTENVGSGVIVSGEGHILTNNHVADPPRGAFERAPTLRVRFVDGREFVARVVGADASTDLALLKIEAKDARLVPATFADSDKIRVGDWCLAIGSPFGYNHTVTAGIVSAKHRRAQLALPYQDFLQTDAAINPGNSGGALVNIKGELIGINTAIVSNTRSHDGVGFAISSNLVKWVKDQLVKDGRVRRGFLGVRTWDLDDELVKELEPDGIRSVKELLEDVGLKDPRGAFVYKMGEDPGVGKGSPAEKAGLKEGDVIVEFDGKPVRSRSELLFRVAETAPGANVTVKVWRDGKEKDLKVELAERQPDPPRPVRRR